LLGARALQDAGASLSKNSRVPERCRRGRHNDLLVCVVVRSRQKPATTCDLAGVDILDIRYLDTEISFTGFAMIAIPSFATTCFTRPVYLADSVDFSSREDMADVNRLLADLLDADTRTRRGDLYSALGWVAMYASAPSGYRKDGR
jgi:hypothetical protein